MEKPIAYIVKKQKCYAPRKTSSLFTKSSDKDFEMQFILEKFPGARTFPQIIVDGKHVGGFDDLEAFLANQE